MLIFWLNLFYVHIFFEFIMKERLDGDYNILAEYLNNLSYSNQFSTDYIIENAEKLVIT